MSAWESVWEAARAELAAGGPERALPLLELAWLEAQDLEDSDLRKGDSLYLLGATLAALGEGERADAALSQALQLRIESVGLGHPLVAAVLHAMGELYRRKGDLVSAHGALQGASEILHRLGQKGDQAVQVEYALGMVLRRLGRYTEGLEHAGRAQAMLPADSPLQVPLLMLLASLAQAVGETSSAASWLERVLPLLPTGRETRRTLLTLIRLRLGEGRLDDAEARLAPLLAAEPSDSELLRLKASLEARRGDAEAAAGWLERAREATSIRLERAAITKELGDLQARQGRWEEAAALYSEAIPGSRGDALLRALLRVALGNARFMQERPQDAKVEYGRAVVRLRKTPAAPQLLLVDALRLLAAALNSTGEPRKAEARVREALGVLEEVPVGEHLDPSRLVQTSRALALVLEELALSYALQERFSELVPVLEQILELRTSGGAAEEELALVEDQLLTACLRAGAVERGLELARQVREGEDDPVRLARIGVSEARLLGSAGRRDEALAVLDAVLGGPLEAELGERVREARRELEGSGTA